MGIGDAPAGTQGPTARMDRKSSSEMALPTQRPGSVTTMLAVTWCLPHCRPQPLAKDANAFGDRGQAIRRSRLGTRQPDAWNQVHPPNRRLRRRGDRSPAARATMRRPDCRSQRLIQRSSSRSMEAGSVDETGSQPGVDELVDTAEGTHRCANRAADPLRRGEIAIDRSDALQGRARPGSAIIATAAPPSGEPGGDTESQRMRSGDHHPGAPSSPPASASHGGISHQTPFFPSVTRV